MSHDFRWLAPTPPEPAHEALEAYQCSQEFYHEVHERHDFERYCQWYYYTAAQHQDEYLKLQNDFNLLGWFNQGW